jgi:phosphopantetheinyl transferase (holo-ACP synthase)
MAISKRTLSWDLARYVTGIQDILKVPSIRKIVNVVARELGENGYYLVSTENVTNVKLMQELHAEFFAKRFSMKKPSLKANANSNQTNYEILDVKDAINRPVCICLV